MLSAEENELVTRIGPGTPAGTLLRQYWQPAALTPELTEGGAPLPLRLLGEDLVLFRDDSGRPGLLGIHCAHRGADLSYGRLEDGGLRCIYHGWLYDRAGRCLEQPGEPAGSTFHERIRHTAYPCVEAGGIIFTYMGPSDPPPLPQFEYLQAPDEHRHATKWYRECNWLQGMEGTLDPQHQGYLHRTFRSTGDPKRDVYLNGAEPIIEIDETENGVCVLSMLQAGSDKLFIKQNRYLVPNITCAAPNAKGYSLHWSVPIDDTHFWMYDAVYNVDPEFHRKRHGDEFAYKNRDYTMKLNKANRYLQDREVMKTELFCGIAPNFQSQDGCVIEGAGPIQDRTQEHLGYIDRGITAMRKALLQAIDAVREGGQGPALGLTPHTRIVDGMIPASLDWQKELRRREHAPIGAGGR
jgi:phenylpropionate dioxygenase-like ring-hydroxylating dioxygenase large terminal subunit